MQAAILVLAMAFLTLVPTRDLGQTGNSAFCKGIQRALTESQRIKPGMKRSEVEQFFRQEGGLQFPDKGHYVYPECAYLKLVVQYELAVTNRKSLTSGEDVVKSVSKLFVEYPIAD